MAIIMFFSVMLLLAFDQTSSEKPKPGHCPNSSQTSNHCPNTSPQTSSDPPAKPPKLCKSPQTGTSSSAKSTKLNTVESQLPPKPSPHSLEAMYGHKPPPVPEGIHGVYGWLYGKIYRGLENDKIFVSQAMADSLNLDFYFQSCPDVEKIVLAQVRSILATNDRATGQLLRLFFHDCFIEGCDASVLLTSDKTTNQVERNAIPNQTLKGFECIQMIKMELEKQCPGVVSCADILAIATRDSISLSAGLFYPILTGRRDSIVSFFDKATAEIPSPFSGNISEILRLFSLRGFSARETVTLLGAHNIGRIYCTVILPRIENKQSPAGPLYFSRFCRGNPATMVE